MPPSVNARNYERKELDVNPALVLAIALGITIGIYALLASARDSYLGILLYERGFTQYLVIFLASMVAVLTLLKYFKLAREAQILRRSWLPDSDSFIEPNSQQLANLQRNLASDRSLLAVRCSRVLAAYRNSGYRQAATELALDDSSFYLSASESSYALPRILVWAIPLLGFIGTVIGISQAVTGFSGFLEESGDVEQIKEGIGTVTSGLATAFDTTLLALFLSVLVMIPLVLVERFESRLLLALDIYINDQLLPRLKNKSENLDEAALNKSVSQAVKEHLPSPEALIEPAREYAQHAATQLAQGFVTHVGKLQEMSATLIERMNQTNQMALQDRQAFVSAFEKQQQANKDLVLEIHTILNEVKIGYSSVSADLAGQAQQISDQLEQAAKILETRIAALDHSTTAQASEFTQLQQSLAQSLRSLEGAAQMEQQQATQVEQVLGEVRNNLAQLQPILNQLSKPRRIMLVEQDES